MTLPGDAADPGIALALVGIDRFPDATVEPVSVGNRPGTLIEYVEPDYDYVERTVISHAAWGDLVVATADGPPAGALASEQLTEVAASVREATGEEWAALLTAAGN